MSDVTRILSAIEQGDPKASEQLLPLVYDELRRLAAQKMSQEAPGQTLQATALVHEAYLRLVDADQMPRWNGRTHFFRAAAEAMRRILVDQSHRKQSLKRGGDWHEIDLEQVAAVEPESHRRRGRARRGARPTRPTRPRKGRARQASLLRRPVGRRSRRRPGDLPRHGRPPLALCPNVAVLRPDRRRKPAGKSESISAVIEAVASKKVVIIAPRDECERPWARHRVIA